MSDEYFVGLGELFTIFFVMVGPLEHLAPFAALTRGMDQKQINFLALRSTSMLVPIMVILGLFGRQLLHEWHIPIPILQLTAGVIFAIMAFRMLLFKKEEIPAYNPDQEFGPLSVALKNIINPYVCGTLIVLLASSRSFDRTLIIFGMFFANLFLTYLAFRYIRVFTGRTGRIFLQILGSVLGVMQTALALSIIHTSLKMLQNS